LQFFWRTAKNFRQGKFWTLKIVIRFQKSSKWEIRT